jgi:hypothetical protein
LDQDFQDDTGEDGQIRPSNVNKKKRKKNKKKKKAGEEGQARPKLATTPLKNKLGSSL